MKSLKFYPPLIPAILSGEKTSTWRLFDDKNLTTGDKLELINKETGETFARAIITNIFEKKLSEMSDADLDGHETYSSPEEMYKIFESYYHQAVNADTQVKIMTFRLI